MAPVSALSTEILSIIFSFAAEYDPHYRFHPRYEYAQVCRSWRTAALQNPHLWSNIDSCTPKGWVPGLLQRSHGANLHVVLDRHAARETVQLITKHLDRIEDLYIDIEYRSIVPSILHENIQSLSAQELPLRTLDATDWSTENLANPPSFPTPQDEDFAIIISRSPRLERLTLRHGVNFLWNTPLPSSLVELHLDNTQRPSLSVFLDVLRQIPQLQQLTLRSCGPKDDTGNLPDTSTHASVNLPDLQAIELTNIDLATESFYRFLNIPPNDVDLHFENGPTQPTPIPVMRYLSERLRHPDDHFRWPSLRHLTIKMWASIGFHLRLSPNPIEATNFGEWKAREPDPDAKKVALEFIWLPADEGIFPWEPLGPFFMHLSNVLPLHNLQILHINAARSNYSFTRKTFEWFIHDLPELVYLEVYVLMQSLWESLEEEQKNIATPSTRLLPKLRYVVVEMGTGRLDGNVDARMAESLDSMENWLSARLASTGSKLARLEFAFMHWDSFPGGVAPGFERFSHLADMVLFSSDD